MTDDDRAPDAAAEPHWVRVARLIAEPPGPVAGGPRPADVNDNRSAVEVLADLLRAEPPDAPSSADTERALALVRARRDAGDLAPADDAGPRPMRGRGIARIAGMLAAAVVLAMVGLDWRRHSVPDRADQARAVAVSGGLALATGIGRVDSLRLPDGTRVVLGPGSRIDTANGYARLTRAVTLHGEGYFDVVHDDARPFVVRTGQALLRDVGTRFTVSTGPSTGTVVSVQGGIVALQDRRRGATAELRLVQGDRARLLDTGAVDVRHDATPDDDLAWTHGRFVLRDASVAEVASALQRWYGVALRVEDRTLARRRVTASFAGESSADVLRVVAAALGGVARVAGDTAYVSAPASTPP